MEIKIQDQSLPKQSGEPPITELQQAVELDARRIKAEAEERFLNEVGEYVTESAQKRKNSSSEGTEASRDKASLSPEGVQRKEELSESPKESQRLRQEAEEQRWKEMKDWTPIPERSIPDEIRDLADIYRRLLLAIGGNPSGEQPSALEQVLSEALLKLLNSRLGELEALFREYGSQSGRNGLRAALYYHITGVALSDREVERFFGISLSETNITADGQGGIRTPVNQLKNQGDQGIIYQPAGEGRIKSDPGYSTRMLKEASISVVNRGSTLGVQARRKSGAQAFVSPTSEKVIHSPEDLALAERFAAHMNQSGNLFTMHGLSGDSEELYGFLAAIMAVKSQIFCSHSGIDSILARELRDAIDRLIDFYIQRQFQRSLDRVPFSPKDAYKTFYYLMNLYQTSGSFEEMADQGVKYAYRQFLKKKECMRESDPTAFFFSKGKKTALEDWKSGKYQVEEDSRAYVALFDQTGPQGLPFGVLELSPWGMFAEPVQSVKKSETRAVSPMLIGSMMVLLLLVFVFIFH